MYLYKYIKSPIEYTKEVKSNYTEYIFSANYATEFEENKQVYVHIFEPKGAVKGDIIFLHGIGNKNISYLEWYGSFFQKKGYRASFTILPYHLQRTPKGYKGGDLFYSANPDKCVVRFHMAIKDVRRTIDMLETMRNYNENKVFLIGVSFGGIIGTMVMALDKRIKKGALIITGGNWRWINFHSTYTGIVREEYRTKGNPYGCNSEEFCVKYFRKDPVKYCMENFNSIEDIFTKSPIPCYQYDPISYAKFVNQEILFVMGKFDKVIPKNASKELFELLPNKKLKIIPTGHKTSIIFKKQMGIWSLKHFEGEANAYKF